MGSLIIEEVVKDLVAFHGLSTASTVFLAGSRYSHVINQSINLSISQSVNQSINQSINQSVSQSVSQSINK